MTPEQLEAVAQALGVTPESLTDAPPVLSDEEAELLKLYKSADADTQNAAAVLKGEKAKGSNPMEAMMSMFSGMMGGGEGGVGGENPMAGMMSMLGGMMGGGEKKEAAEEDKKEE